MMIDTRPVGMHRLIIVWCLICTALIAVVLACAALPAMAMLTVASHPALGYAGVRKNGTRRAPTGIRRINTMEEFIMMPSAQSRLSAIRNIALALTGCAVVAGCQSMGGTVALDPDNTSYKRMVTQGQATTILVENIYECPRFDARMNIRKSAVGQITATDGTVITVPAETAAQKGLGPKSFDLYNECNQKRPANSAAVSTADVPVIEVDADGEVITGFIVADNYYEMYVNGKLVSVDTVPYTPFNSSIVKFKVKRPYTLAFLLVDWDERLGLGMEQFPVPVTPATTMWYPGDGGLVAKFSDGTMTDATWKAQTSVPFSARSRSSADATSSSAPMPAGRYASS